MLKIENKIAQAAIELAVFGAILIFILGTIVRTAAGNGSAQNVNFKAMRTAMLASWNASKAANMSRTSASILFVEDRLSPDIGKYGDLDRNQSISQGSGTFSYEVLYPLDETEVSSNLPIMDVYIDGQQFPFTTAAYYTNQTICRPGTAGCPACGTDGPYPPPSDGSLLTPQQCVQNQCLRNQREWAGGIINASQFDNIIPVTTLNATSSATLTANGIAIFQALVTAGYVATTGGSGSATSGYVTDAFTQIPISFSIIDPTTGQPEQLTLAEIDQIQSLLQGNQHPYKLFYTQEVNQTPQFTSTPPATCTSSQTVSNALCSTLTVLDAQSNPYINTNGDMQYDLLRLGNYTTTLPQAPAGTYPAVEAQFPPGGPWRNEIAWQWAANAATSATSIGLNATNNQYPQYDIDGRLKMVTVYGFSQKSDGSPNVSYEDYQHGDIDSTWDANSCTPKPGLQNNSEIYTFTKDGTYLQILEGKLYNPETDQFVRSVNKRDNVDLIQRQIQLSSNTGRFCSINNPGNLCGSSQDTDTGVTCASPNPVEVCIAPSSSQNCFSTEQNIKSTCYDQSDNMIFVRSRLEDRRGYSWSTDTSGQLQVQ